MKGHKETEHESTWSTSSNSSRFSCFAARWLDGRRSCDTKLAGLIPVMAASSSLSPSVSQVRLLLAPPGLAGLEDDSSFSAARLLFLFSASLPAPPAAAPPSLPPFSLSRSLSLSRLLLVRSDIFTEELLPEETQTVRKQVTSALNVTKKHEQRHITLVFWSWTLKTCFSEVCSTNCTRHQAVMVSSTTDAPKLLHETSCSAHQWAAFFYKNVTTVFKGEVWFLHRNSFLFVLWSSWKRRFWVPYPCLASCFSVDTWEDTTKHSARFTSFTTSVYCIFGRIVWVLMLLRCFQPAVTSATSSSSQNCTVHSNNAAEHRIWL